MIVTSTDNSVVTWLNNDLNGVNGSSRAYVGSATEVYYNYAPGSDTFYCSYQQAAASGAQAYGLTTPGSEYWYTFAIELQAPGAVPRFPVLVARYRGDGGQPAVTSQMPMPEVTH